MVTNSGRRRRTVTTVTVSKWNSAAGDFAFQLEGLYNGGGYVLFIRDGKLNFLEGYAYDEPWPEYLNVTGVQYVQPAVPPAY